MARGTDTASTQRFSYFGSLAEGEEGDDGAYTELMRKRKKQKKGRHTEREKVGERKRGERISISSLIRAECSDQSSTASSNPITFMVHFHSY